MIFCHVYNDTVKHGEYHRPQLGQTVNWKICGVACWGQIVVAACLAAEKYRHLIECNVCSKVGKSQRY